MTDSNVSGEKFMRRMWFAFNVPFIRAPLMIICGAAYLLKSAEEAKNSHDLKKDRPALVVEEDNPWVAQ